METTQDRPPRRRVWQIMAAVGGMTALVSIVAAGKDLFVAGRFGVCDQMDAFVLASVLPLFASSVIGFSFNAALIPTYVKERETRGKEAAQQLLSSTLVWGVLLLIGISVVLGLLFPVLVSLLGAHFSPEKQALTRSLFLILLATIVLRGTMVLYGSVLNANERYKLVSLSPILTPVCVVIAVILLGRRIGVYSLCWGTVVGMLLELTVLGYGLVRSGMSVVPRWYGFTEPVKTVIRQYMPMIAGACLSSSAIIVDQSFASTLGSGSLSVLSYANKIVGLVVYVCATSVSTAVMPHFCTLVAREDWQGIRRAVRVNMRIIILATVAITAALYFGSEFIVRTLFERGAFGPADTKIVAAVQRMCVLQVPFYVARVLMMRLISSLQGNSILLWSAGLSMIVNVALDYVLMREMGIAGIALSTTGVYLFSFVFCWIALNRRMAQMSAGGTSSGCLSQ